MPTQPTLRLARRLLALTVAPCVTLTICAFAPIARTTASDDTSRSTATDKPCWEIETGIKVHPTKVTVCEP